MDKPRLFPPKSPSDRQNISDTSKNEIILIQCDKIYPNPTRPPKHYNDCELSAIASAFRKRGIGIPVFVMNVRSFENEKYILITGEKVFRAALIAKAERLPCVIISSKADLPEKLCNDISNYDEGYKDCFSKSDIPDNNSFVVDAPPPKTTKFVIKDSRFFFNSVNHAIDLMKNGGVGISCNRTETDERVILTITVPKSPPI